MGDSYLAQAKAVYLATEPRELDKGKKFVYTSKQHQFKVNFIKSVNDGFS